MRLKLCILKSSGFLFLETLVTRFSSTLFWARFCLKLNAWRIHYRVIICDIKRDHFAWLWCRLPPLLHLWLWLRLNHRRTHWDNCILTCVSFRLIVIFRAQLAQNATTRFFRWMRYMVDLINEVLFLFLLIQLRWFIKSLWRLILVTDITILNTFIDVTNHMVLSMIGKDIRLWLWNSQCFL